MPLKAILESLDGLSDDVASEYKETTRDGKTVFELQVTPVGDVGLGDVGKLQRTITTTRRERDDFKKQLQAFRNEEGELIDIEAARNAMNIVAELGEDATDSEKAKKALEAKEQQLIAKYEAQRKQLIEKYDGDLKAAQETTGKIKSQLQKALIDNEAALAITKHDGIPQLLLPVIRSSTKMVQDDDGTFRAHVLDESGHPRLSQRPNSGTDPMSVEEFVEVLKTDQTYGQAFKSSNASGGGGTTPNRSGATGKFTISQQDAKDPAKYRAARAEAEKAGQSLQVVE